MLSMYIKTEIYFTIDISISKYFLPNNQVYRFLFGLNNWKLQYHNTYNKKSLYKHHHTNKSLEHIVSRSYLVAIHAEYILPGYNLHTYIMKRNHHPHRHNISPVGPHLVFVQYFDLYLKQFGLCPLIFIFADRYPECTMYLYIYCTHT